MKLSPSSKFRRQRLTPFLIFVSFAAVAYGGSRARAADSPRERLSMDAGWRFHLGDNWGLGERLAKAGESSGPAGKKFDDSSWRLLNIPHDWAVELPFDEHADYDHGYKPVGPRHQDNSVGWYRRAFRLTEADRGKRLWLEFDGVYRDSRIFVNGFLLAHQESGYNGFRCDITDVANCNGNNVLAVRVDASEFEGWFYEGAGIYRHVWLEKTSPIAIAPDGLFVWSTFKDNLPQGPASIHASVELTNSTDSPVKATVIYSLRDPAGKTVAEAHGDVKLEALSHKVVLADADGLSMSLSIYQLWSPESPVLYKLDITVKSGANGDEIVDQTTQEFGIRTVGFSTTDGFLLNGARCPIKGTCDHQDHAGVGVAVPDALVRFRVAKLKEMGCNAIRTSHNEPAPELLDACDRLGMLVMDENRRLGSDPQNLACLDQQVKRDRNHPSIFIWSLANEEHSLQRSEVGARVYNTMQNTVHQLDPTRPCTVAMDGRAQGKADGFSSVADVTGFNYIHRGDMDVFHRANPAIPCIGTEESSAYYTRGVYENSKTYKSAYEGNKPDYGTTAEQWWAYYAARPWASGSFVWTGFDYRGEASPFHWPNISSEFGILDTCGFPKDHYYYYQSVWTHNSVLHLMPHWNWPGKQGQDTNVCVFSNCQEVELFLNGQSLGRKSMPINSHLDWQVKYATGTLSAKGYSDGKLTVESNVETTGSALAVQLNADRGTINADAQDCSIVTVSVVDADGRTVPTANNQVHFEITGPGRIIGIGNGDPTCHEPDVYIDGVEAGKTVPAHWQRTTFNGLAQIIVQAASDPGQIQLTATAQGLKPFTIVVHSTPKRTSPFAATRPADPAPKKPE